MKKPRVIGAFEPPAYDETISAALRALADGVAVAGQQRKALDWIIQQAARTYDLSYRPGGTDGERDTAFHEGRRFVGLQIVKVMKLIPAEK